jgi:hypothetical protein
MSRRSAWTAAILTTAALVAAGCSLISPTPTARFDVTPTVLYAGEAVRLDASASLSDSAIIDYSWDFGSGETASGREVTTTFARAGRYTVSLRIQNAAGRTDVETQEITVYVRGGTLVFEEDFSSGESAIGKWFLDPTWASADESRIELILGSPGYCLFVDSGPDRWHRRYVNVTFPPLRVGQKLVFSCKAMTLQNQDAHTFIIVPGRRDIDTVAGSLPFFEFTSNGGGSYMREPSGHGPGVGHVVPFTPQIYGWHTYRLVYSEGGYELWIDDVLQISGPNPVDLSEGGAWHILLGEESSTESCTTYFDDIRLRIEE